LTVRGGCACAGDRIFGGQPREILELVDHVPVGAECEAGVMAKLAGDVDHGAALMEQQ
jgi:hypothetical protein